MGTVEASSMLRPDLLEGVQVLLAGPVAEDDGERMGDAVEIAFTALRARVIRCALLAGASHASEEAATDAAVAAALTKMPGIDMLVVDAAALFAGGRAAAEEPLTENAGAALGSCLQAAWTVTRSVFNLAFLPSQRGGRVVYLAPRADAGPHSQPALAGLENLSRTLSIEWSRHGVTAVTVAPGHATTDTEVAALAAYLASPAGDYFSGCLLDLRGEKAASGGDVEAG
jgi:citronellol/citronellal dehydrogenase